jgi:fimbrial chaperone protein
MVERATMKFIKTLAATAAIVATPLTAIAYQVTPMIYDLAPAGTNAASVIRINNTQDQPITVEILAEQRLFDEAGKESRKPADDKFVLFPPQAIVQPGATQAVRVQYVGPQTLDKSETYTVTVKQIPVQLPNDGKTGVQFVFNFSTVANIVPPGAKAQIAAPVDTLPLSADRKTLRLTLRNTGTKYANLSRSSVELAGGAYRATVKDEEWRKALGTSWILPGGTRVIELPKPDKAPAQLTATFKFVELQN